MSNTPALSAHAIRERATRRHERALEVIERASDLLVLDVLWLLSCLAVLPAYAGTAALQGSARRWAAGEEVPALRAFTEELRSTWRRATVLGLGWTLAGALLLLDVRLVGLMSGNRQAVMGAGLAVLCLGFVLTTCWLGAALSAGHGGLSAVRSAARQVGRHPFVTLAGVGIAMIAAFAIAAMPVLVVAVPAFATYAWCLLTRTRLPLPGADG